LKPKLSGRLNGLNGRASSGADIIDNYDARAFLLKTLDSLAHAVGFFGLAYQETVNGLVGLGAEHGNRADDWISAQCQPANRYWLPSLALNKLQKNAPGQLGSLRMERGCAAINVIVTFQPRGERKTAQAERVGSNKLKELVAV